MICPFGTKVSVVGYYQVFKADVGADLLTGTVLPAQVKDEVMDYLVASCSRLAISQSDTGGAVDVQVADVQTLTGLNVSLPAPAQPSHIMFSTRLRAIVIIVAALGRMPSTTGLPCSGHGPWGPQCKVL